MITGDFDRRAELAPRLPRNMWRDPISLPIFLACYFFTLAIAWVLAVRIAEC